MSNSRTVPNEQAAAREADLVAKLVAEGKNAEFVRGIIILMKRGCADLLAEVAAGRFTIKQALKHARGRS